MKIHCLHCYEPQEDITLHLATVCLRDSTEAERAAEVQRAEASALEWMDTARVWDFKEICTLLPDSGSQMVLVKELIRRGFLVRNQPAPSLLPTSASDDAIPSHGKK